MFKLQEELHQDVIPECEIAGSPKSISGRVFYMPMNVQVDSLELADENLELILKDSGAFAACYT